MTPTATSTATRTATRSVELIGHRGAPRDRPENTLAAFDAALARGADGIELDVHATADGAVVVHHDPVLAGADRPIASLDSSEVARHRVRGEPVPTLDAVLDLCAGRARVYVELKGRGIEHLVIDRIRAHRAECAVHSFDHRAVRRARELAPALRRGILLDAYLVDVAAALRAADAQDLWQEWRWIDGPLVDAARAAGARVVAWTVNQPADGRALVAAGVEAVCTDALPALAELRGAPSRARGTLAGPDGPG
jgi:glycerophosphoryl diester phosphodiesterase